MIDALTIYWLVIYALVLYAVNELTTTSKAGTILVTLIPLLFIPLLMEGRFSGWFNMLKSLTLLFVLLYATLIRVWMKGKWARAFLVLLLIVNILQAIAKDVELGHYFNVVTGIIVIAILPLPSTLELKKIKSIDVDQAIYPMSWASIIVYTLWHICFMYGYQSGRGFAGDYVILNLMVLAIPFLASWYRGPGYWLQSRAYTLSFNVLLIEASVVHHPEFWPLTPELYQPVVYQMLSGGVMVFTIGYLIYLLLKRPHQIANTFPGRYLLHLPYEEPSVSVPSEQ